MLARIARDETRVLAEWILLLVELRKVGKAPRLLRPVAEVAHGPAAGERTISRVIGPEQHVEERRGHAEIDGLVPEMVQQMQRLEVAEISPIREDRRVGVRVHELDDPGVEQ